MAAVPSEGRAAAAPLRRHQPEDDATRLLYEQHYRKIFAFCRHQLGNREEAEDAAQITFMNAFRGLTRGISPEFELAWLFKIAHNVCLTKQRNAYRRRLVEAPDVELVDDLLPAHESDADELFGLSQALRVLPEQQRRALLLREWQGLTYREIATEMSVTQSAVETLIFRARRSLVEALTTGPIEKRRRGRPRTTSNAGSLLATLKSLLLGLGVKAAATVATVTATGVVAATPTVRHDMVDVAVHAHLIAPATAPHKRAPTFRPARDVVPTQRVHSAVVRAPHATPTQVAAVAKTKEPAPPQHVHAPIVTSHTAAPSATAQAAHDPSPVAPAASPDETPTTSAPTPPAADPPGPAEAPPATVASAASVASAATTPAVATPTTATSATKRTPPGQAKKAQLPPVAPLPQPTAPTTIAAVPPTATPVPITPTSTPTPSQTTTTMSTEAPPGQSKKDDEPGKDKGHKNKDD